MQTKNLDFKIPEKVNTDSFFDSIYFLLFVGVSIALIVSFFNKGFDPVFIASTYLGVKASAYLEFEPIKNTWYISLGIFFLMLYPFAMMANRDSKKLASVGDKNEVENNNKINSCKDINGLIKLIDGTRTEFIHVANKKEMVLQSQVALNYFKEMSEKIKLSPFYEALINNLDSDTPNLMNFEIFISNKSIFDKY